MSPAQRVLIGYGTVILLVGFALGAVLGILRTKAPPIRSLATAHVETLMQASLLLALAWAIGAVGFHSSPATWAAWLLLAGSAMQATGVTLNWITKTGDQFAERSPGMKIATLGSFFIWPGVAIIAWGILTRL
jgi:hypothetical protein